MIQKFVTNKDINGNRYTLEINHENKTYTRDYNKLFYDGYVELSKKALNEIESVIIKAGYKEIF